ncbi:hypothetical protein YK48G_04410 [Lentilactobacillus fungorum]|uniref:Uncharacterized protein n=1 Tax=Lentilactobacillus fungorum TaxID=2201250 RepID=A0ABQ3VYE3_9LACO|nr:hypothetical protein [Lentilactobacillus fungorum]GHP13016.1 hypothetical protein YK48G_04410 [Lentilactobacillus fungorum]
MPDKAPKESTGTEVKNDSTPDEDAVSNKATQNDETNAQLDEGYENIVQPNSSSLWSISSLRNNMPNEIRSYLIGNFITFIVWVTMNYGSDLAEQTVSVLVKWITYLEQQG